MSETIKNCGKVLHFLNFYCSYRYKLKYLQHYKKEGRCTRHKIHTEFLPCSRLCCCGTWALLTGHELCSQQKREKSPQGIIQFNSSNATASLKISIYRLYLYRSPNQMLLLSTLNIKTKHLQDLKLNELNVYVGMCDNTRLRMRKCAFLASWRIANGVLLKVFIYVFPRF